MKKAASFGFAVLVSCGLLIATCVSHSGGPPTSDEAAANRRERELVAKFDAEGTASAAVKGRAQSPASFELVEAAAARGKTDEGVACWIVAVTYRATNSVGGVVTERALVYVDETAESPLKVIDIR